MLIRASIIEVSEKSKNNCSCKSRRDAFGRRKVAIQKEYRLRVLAAWREIIFQKSLILIFLSLLCCLLLYFGCTPKQSNELNARQSAEWVKDAIIYEVYLRSFSKEGTFKALESRLTEIKKLGVTIISLMPIHPIGELNRRGRLGSPYAVKDFYAVNSEYGTIEDFKSLVKAAHEHEIKIIIDLVANHAAWDSQLLMEHPEWFVHNEEGAIVSPNAQWIDVAKLDYNQHEPRKYMIAMMKYWVQNVDIDGFKGSFAELVPIDFWNIARQELDKIKPIVMISESKIPEHHLKAFDITYSWEVGHVIRDIVDTNITASVIDDSLKIETSRFPVGALHLRSRKSPNRNIENDMLTEGFSSPRTKLSSVLVFTLSGVPLIFNGEEVGNDKQLDLFNKVEIDWLDREDIRAFYEQMIQLRKTHLALRDGAYISVANTESAKVYSFMRTSETNTVLVVINFSNLKKEAGLKLLSGSNNLWRDEISNLKYQVKDSLLTVPLLPLGYSILVQAKESEMR